MQITAECLPGRPPSFLPYYLDLAVELIRDNANGFTPDMLGETPAELEQRFLRSLEPNHRRALQTLAVALEFDRETFEFLIGDGASGFIAGYKGTDFPSLVGEHWSFVNPIGGRPGFHRFHRHMQASLIASLQPAEETSRAKEILLALLERLAERMKFDCPADFGLVQETAFSTAFDLMREHEAKGLLDSETAVEQALVFEAPFDNVQAASLRRPALEWTETVARRTLGEDHPKTLSTRNNIAHFTGQAGEPAAARDLFRALLPDFERVLGPDHPDTLWARKLIAHFESAGDVRASPMTERYDSLPRNSSCPCGSGKRFKHCHGNIE